MSKFTNIAITMSPEKENVDKGYKFKFISEAYLDRIQTLVKRKRSLEKENQQWGRHIASKHHNQNTNESQQNIIKPICTSSDMEGGATATILGTRSKSVHALVSIPEEASSSSSEYSMLSDCECFKDNVPNEQGQPLKTDNKKLNSPKKQCSLPDLRNQGDDGVLKIFACRIKNLRRKIETTLGDIYTSIDQIPEPDGIQDLVRRRQRSVEFSSRFCRNYLYQFRRQVSDLKQQVKHSSCYGMLHYYHLSLNQKLINAYQTAHLALQAYLNHMPTSLAIGLPNKLKELLVMILDVSHILAVTNILGEDSSFGDCSGIPLEERCKDLLTVVKESDEEGFEKRTHGETHSKTLSETNRKEIVFRKLAMYRSKITAVGARSKIRKCSMSWQQRRAKSRSIMERQPETPVSEIFSSKNPKDVGLVRMPHKLAVVDGVGFDSDHVKTVVQRVPPESNNEIDEQDEIVYETGNMLSNDDFCQALSEILLKHPCSKSCDQLCKEKPKDCVIEPCNVHRCKEDLNSVLNSLCGTLSSMAKSSHQNKRTNGKQMKNVQLIEVVFPEEELRSSTSETKVDYPEAPNTYFCDAGVQYPNEKIDCRTEDKSNVDQCIGPETVFPFTCKTISNSPEIVIYKQCYQTTIENLYLYNCNKKPWHIVSRVTDLVVTDILNQVLDEMTMDELLKEMYELELQ